MRIATYCPNCKSDKLSFDGTKKYFCLDCNWEYYHNTAAAVAGILEYEDKILTVVRNKEPGKGMLDFPGGFVDSMESAETALKREIMEELNIDLLQLNYLCSAPNIYSYKGIEYSTCDMFYTAKPEHINFKIEKSEIAAIEWKSADSLNPDEFSFSSMRNAVRLYKNKIR